QAEANGVKELSEGGIAPAAYQKEWQTIFTEGVRPSKALGAACTLKFPFIEDYPAKRERTLTDGTRGYNDFSYNWLCFDGTSMECVIDLGNEKDIHSIEINFLQDQRHWIFPPKSVTVSSSGDGNTYQAVKNITAPALKEDYDVKRVPFTFPANTKTRYIKVTAQNYSTLPDWRFHKTKKPIIACDEVWVD
ncbi:MAG: discoidin domain-containing protein, partial [Niabella sp.]|nr:discoidin domain-containing protein [Niabella sp.]